MAAKHVGKQLLSTGAQVASDVMSGENVGHSLKHRFKETGTKLLGDAVSGVAKVASGGQPHTKRRKKGKRRAKEDLF